VAVLTVRPAELPSRPLAKAGLPVGCLCVRMSWPGVRPAGCGVGAGWLRGRRHPQCRDTPPRRTGPHVDCLSLISAKLAPAPAYSACTTRPAVRTRAFSTPAV